MQFKQCQQYHMWQLQVEKEYYSYHFLTTFFEFALL